MSEIPEDILRQAFDLMESMKSNKDDALTTSDSRYASLLTDDANVIARAILAERERCAAIADARADAYAEIANKHDGTPIGESNTMRCGAAAAIADAIRGQS